MPAYTLHCLDSAGQITRAARYIAAETDEQEIAYVRDEKLSVYCELWEHNRLVAQIPAQSGS
jgi:hypothetical protein